MDEGSRSTCEEAVVQLWSQSRHRLFLAFKFHSRWILRENRTWMFILLFENATSKRKLTVIWRLLHKKGRWTHKDWTMNRPRTDDECTQDVPWTRTKRKLNNVEWNHWIPTTHFHSAISKRKSLTKAILPCKVDMHWNNQLFEKIIGIFTKKSGTE